MTMRSSLFTLLVAAGLAGSVPAFADDDDDVDSVRSAVERGEILPLGRLRTLLRAQYPGEIIDMDLDHDDGRYIYEFKVLQADGRLVEIEMDAAKGTILEVDDD